VAGGGEHSASCGCLVDGALVVLVVGELAAVGGPEQDVRTLGVEDLRLALVQHHVAVVPPAALEVQPVHVGTVLRLHVRRLL
jgi:hypothetical protein